MLPFDNSLLPFAHWLLPFNHRVLPFDHQVLHFDLALGPLTGEWCMQIIDRIVEHHLHRVYVVNDRGQAVGVVTLTDLLRRVTEEARKA